jgi:hypothetical protein
MPKIPSKTRKETRRLLNRALTNYYAEAEEHEDDDIVEDTDVEGRLNDFATWFHGCRFKTAR